MSKPTAFAAVAAKVLQRSGSRRSIDTVLVVPLASHAANFVTGAITPVDGGASARYAAIGTLDPTRNKYKLRASMRMIAAPRQWRIA